MSWNNTLTTDLYGYVAPFGGTIVSMSGTAGANVQNCTDCSFVISVYVNKTEFIPPVENFPLGTYGQPGSGNVSVNAQFNAGDIISVDFGASLVAPIVASAQISIMWNYNIVGPAYYTTNMYPGGTVFMGSFAMQFGGSIVGISATAGAGVSSCNDCSFVISINKNGTQVIPPIKDFPLEPYSQPSGGYITLAAGTYKFNKGDILSLYFGASLVAPIQAIAWLAVIPE